MEIRGFHSGKQKDRAMVTNEDIYVYYAAEDHVHLGRRLLIDLIDGFLLGCLWLFTLIALFIANPSPETSRTIFWSAILGSTLFYLVLLKYFARTLGYLICDARVVNLQGKRPSILALALRS